MPLYLRGSTVVEHIVTNPLVVPSYVNDATVTVTIKDSKGVDLVGPTFPVNVPYVAASEGVYRYTFVSLPNLIAGEIYQVIFNVVGSDSLEDECIIKERAILKVCS